MKSVCHYMALWRNLGGKEITLMLGYDALKFVHNVKASAARNRDNFSILISLAIMEGSISCTIIYDVSIVRLCKIGSDCVNFALYAWGALILQE